MSEVNTGILPFKFEAREVRSMIVNGQPWFVGADVCAALRIANVSLAINGRADRDSDGLDEDERGIATVNTPSGEQEMLIVNESGLYALIFKSRKKEAKRFKRWVTAEVLPAIRKHGRYEINPQQGALRGELVFNYKGHAIRVLERETGWLFCLDDMVPAWTSSRSPARVDQILWRVPERDRVAMRLGGQSVVLLGEGPMWSLLDRLPDTLLRQSFAAWFREELLPGLRSRSAPGVGATTIGTDGFHVLGAVIAGKVRSLPRQIQRRATMRLWAQLHAAFNVRSAEDIPAAQLDSARTFIAAYTLEGEYLPKAVTELPDLNYPLARWRAENPHLKECPGQPGVLGVSVMALNPMDTRSPTRHLLGQVEAAGYDVEACRVEFNAMRDHLDVLHGVLCQYQSSMQTMSQRRFGYRLRQAG